MNIKKFFAGVLTAAVAASAMIIPSSAADSYTAHLFIADSQWIGQYWSASDSSNTLASCVTNATVSGNGKYTVSLDASKGFTKDTVNYTDMKDLAVLGVQIDGAGSAWKDATLKVDKLTVDGTAVAVSGASSRIDSNGNLRIDLFNSSAAPKVECINGALGTFSRVSIDFTLSGVAAPAPQETEAPASGTEAPAASGDGTTAPQSAPTGVKDASGILIIAAIAMAGAVVSRKKKDE